jgi:hypothetical protein
VSDKGDVASPQGLKSAQMMSHLCAQVWCLSMSRVASVLSVGLEGLDFSELASRLLFRVVWLYRTAWLVPGT